MSVSLSAGAAGGTGATRAVPTSSAWFGRAAGAAPPRKTRTSPAATCDTVRLPPCFHCTCQAPVVTPAPSRSWKVGSQRHQRTTHRPPERDGGHHVPLSPLTSRSKAAPAGASPQPRGTSTTRK